MLKDYVDQSETLDQAIMVNFPPFIIDILKSTEPKDIQIKVHALNDPDRRLFRHFLLWNQLLELQ